MTATETITNIIPSPSLTQQQILTGIGNAIIANCPNAVKVSEELASSTMYQVFRFTYDVTKTYGKIFLKIELTSALNLATYCSDQDGNYGTKYQPFGTTNMVSSSPIEVRIFQNDLEFSIPYITQTASAPIGIINPIDAPKINENYYPKASMIAAANFSTLRTPKLNAYSPTAESALGLDILDATMANPDSLNDNQIDVIEGVWVRSPTSKNVGRYGKILNGCWGCFSGKALFSEITKTSIIQGQSITKIASILSNSAGGFGVIKQ